MLYNEIKIKTKKQKKQSKTKMKEEETHCIDVKKNSDPKINKLIIELNNHLRFWLIRLSNFIRNKIKHLGELYVLSALGLIPTI